MIMCNNAPTVVDERVTSNSVSCSDTNKYTICTSIAHDMLHMAGHMGKSLFLHPMLDIINSLSTDKMAIYVMQV